MKSGQSNVTACLNSRGWWLILSAVCHLFGYQKGLKIIRENIQIRAELIPQMCKSRIDYSWFVNQFYIVKNLFFTWLFCQKRSKRIYSWFPGIGLDSDLIKIWKRKSQIWDYLAILIFSSIPVKYHMYFGLQIFVLWRKQGFLHRFNVTFIFNRCIKLENILMCGNQITSMDVDGLACLKNLAVLDLQNNSIDQVPPELGNLKQIRSLSLEGNAFRVPRPAILVKGTQAVMAYLRDRIPHDSASRL